MFFASDNTAPVTPEVMAALARANEGYAKGYGADALTARAVAEIRRVFEAPEAVVEFVSTGTAANALALGTLTAPWSAVFCHAHAHIHEAECGAPEFYTGGAKLIPLDGADGRIDPAALDARIEAMEGDRIRGVQLGMLSLTNVTEAGTVYTPAQIATLAAAARRHDMPVHLDGARLANALAATGATPAEMTWQAGVDAVSFGGTKNGCLGVEAVIFFGPARAREFLVRRKRGGHTMSKTRFLAAQFEGYLQDGLWLARAAHANAMAARLATGLSQMGAGFLHPTDANLVFPHWPAGRHAGLEAAGAVYYRHPAPLGREAARFVTSWSTTEADVDSFLGVFAG